MADTNPLAFLSFVNSDFPTRIELVEDAHDEESSKGPASLIAFITPSYFRSEFRKGEWSLSSNGGPVRLNR